MSAASDLITEAYTLAKKGRNLHLRELIADNATWTPSRKGKWKPCSDADQIVKTLLWRAGPANHMRPSGEMFELGQSVAFRVRGRRLERIGAQGFWAPKLFQVVDVKAGKIVRMRDYGTLEEALAGTGQDS